MHSLLKPTALLFCIVLGASAFAAGKDDKPKPQTKSEKKDKPKDAKKDGEKKPSTPAKDDDAPISIPIPLGHDSKGLRIPYLVDGRKQMEFIIGLGRRIDAQRVEMEKLQLDTYTDAGDPEMTIDLPQSVLNCKTRVLATEADVTIKRSDFELTAKGMSFDTRNRTGTFSSEVRMLIFNTEDFTKAGDEAAEAEKPATLDAEPKPKTQ